MAPVFGGGAFALHGSSACGFGRPRQSGAIAGRGDWKTWRPPVLARERRLGLPGLGAAVAEGIRGCPHEHDNTHHGLRDVREGTARGPPRARRDRASLLPFVPRAPLWASDPCPRCPRCLRPLRRTRRSRHLWIPCGRKGPLLPRLRCPPPWPATPAPPG